MMKLYEQNNYHTVLLYIVNNCLLGNIANTIGFDHNYLSNLRSSEYEEEVSERRKLPRDQIRRTFFETLAVETTATNREDFFSTKRFKVKYILLEVEIQQYIPIFFMKNHWKEN